MYNTRISTTISPKHAAILKKHAKEHGTQQKVLELALETFDRKASPEPTLSPEEVFILRVWKEKVGCMIDKELFSVLIKTADLKENEAWFNANKMYMAFGLELLYQKPFKELILWEILDGLVFLSKTGNWFNRYTYSDEGDHYTLWIYHNFGLNGSKYLLIMIENIFNSCGAKYTSSVSEKTLFVKIFK